MSTVTLVRCDGCGLDKDSNADPGGPWISITAEEAPSGPRWDAQQAMNHPPRPPAAGVVVYGPNRRAARLDYCSSACAANHLGGKWNSPGAATGGAMP